MIPSPISNFPARFSSAKARNPVAPRPIWLRARRISAMRHAVSRHMARLHHVTHIVNWFNSYGLVESGTTKRPPQGPRRDLICTSIRTSPRNSPFWASCVGVPEYIPTMLRHTDGASSHPSSSKDHPFPPSEDDLISLTIRPLPGIFQLPQLVPRGPRSIPIFSPRLPGLLLEPQLRPRFRSCLRPRPPPPKIPPVHPSPARESQNPKPNAKKCAIFLRERYP
ncbi:hypothetical protein G7046_g5244 [Stylonectria norvegica]|nr:hypothetical protein G7046_g5244 [Stylonectria norvegica]